MQPEIPSIRSGYNILDSSDREWLLKSTPNHCSAFPEHNIAWPKISVITPSYNQGSLIERTIRSVLLQGYPNLEYIVIDGDSSDETVNVLKKYEPWINYWISEPDTGQSHAINKGISKASGEILGWLNSDDYYTPGTLEAIARRLITINQHNVGAIVGGGDIVSESGEQVYVSKTEHVSLNALYDWADGKNFMQPSCFFTRKAWEECGPLDENLRYTMDLDLWLKISKKFEFEVIEEVLSHSLAHAEAKTTAYLTESDSPEAVNSLRKLHQEMALVIARHGGFKQGKSILDGQLNQYLELHQTLVELQNSKPYRFAVLVRKIKEKLMSGGRS